MIEAVFAAVGALAGGAVVWFLRKAREAERLGAERESRVRLETELTEARKNLAEQKALLDEAQAKLGDVFRAAAGDALRTSNEQFLKLAEQTLKSHVVQASGDLDLRKQAVEELVKPIQEALQQVREKTEALEKERQQAYGGITNLLQTVSATQQKLKEETGNLVSALRQPNVRGRWGELTLRRVVELAGLSEHCDFTEQQTASEGAAAGRPDLIVHLPNHRDIVVDAKAVLTGYLDALESTTDEARQAALERHSTHLWDRVTELSRKEYWNQFSKAAEFVVLFVPGEPFLAAAVQQDPDLIVKALEKRVVIATPTTLVALLKAVEQGWKQERLARNAQKVAEVGKQLFDSVVVWTGHLHQLRKSVFDTVNYFNKAQASLDANVRPKAERLKELGIRSDKEIRKIEPVDELVRPVEPPQID